MVGAFAHSAPVYATIRPMSDSASSTDLHPADTAGHRRVIRRTTTIGVAVALVLLVALAVVLHLIDSRTYGMADRSAWCPVGQGVIPYRTLLPGVRPEAVVLEFEDMSNPLASRPFLAGVFGGGDRG